MIDKIPEHIYADYKTNYVIKKRHYRSKERNTNGLTLVSDNVLLESSGGFPNS